MLCCALQDMSLKCNEEGKSLSNETFTKVSLTSLRRQAVPDLSADLGMNIFKKVRDVQMWGKNNRTKDTRLHQFAGLRGLRFSLGSPCAPFLI